VDPRKHTVEARAPGKNPFSRSSSPAEHELVTLDVALEDEHGGSPIPPPAPADTHADPATAPAKEGAPRAHGDVKTGAILATAGAVVLAGAGVGAFLVAGGKQSDARGECATRTGDCDDLRGGVRTWDALAMGSWVAAAALGTVAVVLWLTPDASAKVACARPFVGPGSAGVAGTF
jgi:hypothetical protein